MTKIPQSAFPKEFQNSEAKWSTVNYNSASKIMKDVFNKYENYRLKGKKQMIVNRELFTQEKMQNKLESIVDKMLDSMAQKVELKLPKLQEKADSVKLKLPTLKKG